MVSKYAPSGATKSAAVLAAFTAALLTGSAVALAGGLSFGSAPQRPEMRSYQPYTGLQFGFRPEPPGRRGIRPEPKTRPEIIMPEPVSPLIEYGTSTPHAGQYYRYCPRPTGCR